MPRKNINQFLGDQSNGEGVKILHLNFQNYSLSLIICFCLTFISIAKFKKEAISFCITLFSIFRYIKTPYISLLLNLGLRREKVITSTIHCAVKQKILEEL